MYKRVLLLVSVQRWEWEAWGHARWKCWGGGGRAWTRQWFFVLGWRRRTGNAVVSGDQQVLYEPQEEQIYAEGLPLPHPTGHACMVAVSKFVLNGFGGKTSFQKGEKRDVRALPSLLPVLEQEPSHPSSPGSPLHSQPEWRGEAGAVQSESRVLEEKQAKEEPAVRPGRVHRDSHVQTRGNLPHPRSPTLMSHFVLPSNGS